MPRRILVPLIVACALFMQNLDSTVLSTALPAIADGLHEPPLRLHLALTSYLLSLAVFLPLSGWMADKFGARTVFCAAIVLFTGASAACGFAQSLAGLIAARVAQGIGGAMMVPVGRLILLRSVPKSELVGAMAWLGMPALIGPVVGPPVGGFLTTYASWRWIFWINIPIGALGILLALLFIEDVRDEIGPFDGVGFLLSGIGLAATLFGLEAATSEVLSLRASLIGIAVGVAAFALYVPHARRVRAPILDLGLLRIPTFQVSVVGGGLFRLGVGALPFLLPLMLQAGFGYTAFQSGLVTFASAAGAMGMKAVAPRLLRAFGFRAVLTWNAAIGAAFIAACALFRPATPYVVMVSVLFVGGVFRSLQFTALNTIAFADIPAKRMSQATSFSSMAQQLALSLGVSLAAVILHHGRGHAALSPGDFALAFSIVGAVSATSALFNWRLAPDAGAELAGRAATLPRPATPAAPYGDVVAPSEAVPRKPSATT